jgi:hypothetical protein
VDERSPGYWRQQAADYRRRADGSRYAVVRLYFLRMAMRCERQAEEIEQVEGTVRWRD